MTPDINNINWFEIPVTGLGRAKHFYQVVFSIHMHEEEKHCLVLFVQATYCMLSLIQYKKAIEEFEK